MSEINNTMTPAQCADALEALLNETRQELTEAENDYKAAQLRLDAKKRTGTRAEVAFAEAAVEGTKERYDNARYKLPAQIEGKLTAIRSAMNKSLQIGGLADPEQVDMATVELLKSGVMTPADLENLGQKALQKGNDTMLRLIVAEAERKYNELVRDNGAAEKRKEYLAVVGLAQKSKTHEYTAAFDAVAYVLQRSFLQGGGYFDAQKSPVESALAILRK